MGIDMKEETKSKVKKILFIVLTVVLAVAVTVGFLFYFQSVQNNAIYDERKDTQIHSAEKASTIVETTRESIWPDLDSIEYALQEVSFQAEDEVFAAIKTIAETRQFANTKILLVNDKANYYCSDGQIGYFDDVDFLMEAMNDRATTIGFIPHLGNHQSYLLFTKPVAIPAPVGNIRFIVLCVDARVLAEKLQNTHAATDSETLIIEANGSRIFDTGEESVLRGYNIFRELENYTFTRSGSLESFLNSARKGAADAEEFTALNGRKYFISCGEHLEDDWVVLEIVPSDMLGTKLSLYMNKTLISLSCVFLFVLALVITSALFFLRSRAEKARREKEEMANEALKKIAETERAASEAKSDFLSNMSHDIRTPINGIMGMTTIALKDPADTSRVEDCLHKIEGASSHLLSLVNDVLDMSRIERKKTVIAHEPIDIRTVSENVSAIVNGQLEDRSLNYHMDLENITHPYVFGDELHIRQILINIIGNAIKFTKDGGSISFRVREVPQDDMTSTYHFEVEDTGVGMKPEFVTKVFEAFAQEEGGSRTTYKGTGLGMAISKQLSELMGGTIEVESEYEKGSKFTLIIPMTIDTKPREEEEEEELEDLEGLRILMAEDNELNQEIAQELLEDVGATVEVADNGLIAVSKFRDNPPGTFDLILMDVMMPEMDGIEATKTIRALDREDAKTIPILAMTANAFEEDKKKVLDAGMNAHLSKPIEMDLVMKTISIYVHKK